jgi:hypothetical protein
MNYKTGVVLVELIAIDNFVKQVPSLNQLHHDPVAGFVLQNLEDTCDVWVISFFQHE